MSMLNFDTSNCIALASTVISLIALLKSFLTGRKAKQLDLLLKQQQLQQHEIEMNESKKADVEVNAILNSNGYGGILKFYNKGKAVASNVSFSIPSDEGVDNIRLRMSNDYLPYPKLQPQQGVQIKYQDSSGASHQTIHIVWNDEFAKGRAKDMVIDM